MLQRLLEIPSADLKTALALACDAVASAMRADKVDAFLFHPSNNSLVAVGASNQPLSELQRSIGLDVMPLANGGRAVQVYQTKRPFRTGRLREDPSELKGIREVLKVESAIGVPIAVAGQTRGVLLIVSQQRDFYCENDERFAMSITRWVGSVAHRAELAEEIGRNAVEEGRRAAAEDLILTVAHDLRNFISPIRGRVHLIHRRAEQDKREPDQRDSAAALGTLERLSRLVEDILDVTRIDQGLLRLDPKPVDLAALARDVARTLSTPTHDISVTQAEEVFVTADLARVTQCLENIVSNAIHHSPRGAPVLLVVSREHTDDGDVGMLKVVDQGPGIPSEVLPRIFDRFATGHGSLGVGLGLYLAQSIARSHGGTLVVESRPGKGARFCLRLPVYAPDGAPALDATPA